MMKEEEKLRQRDREAASASCPPRKPSLPVKKETSSPKLSPPAQKRWQMQTRPSEQCRAFPTSVIRRTRSSRDEEHPEPQEVPRHGQPVPPQGAQPHSVSPSAERMGLGLPSPQQFPMQHPYHQQNPRNFPPSGLPPRQAQDLGYLSSSVHHHPSLPYHQNLPGQAMGGRSQYPQPALPHHHYPPQLRAGYHPGGREMQNHPGLGHPLPPPPQTLPLSLAMPPLDPINTAPSPITRHEQRVKRSTVICQGGGRYLHKN